MNLLVLSLMGSLTIAVGLGAQWCPGLVFVIYRVEIMKANDDASRSHWLCSEFRNTVGFLFQSFLYLMQIWSF
ncbi:hypothetical protein [Aeromonas sp. HMWF015]|uniref:hypothetical protein n=1 Tax=Aeromonas sp. HMWF015 TaxID=2056851 RepID=UPI001C62E58F|nr:hypothetical protein [Aeromonas sp. HMWF015]